MITALSVRHTGLLIKTALLTVQHAGFVHVHFGDEMRSSQGRPVGDVIRRLVTADLGWWRSIRETCQMILYSMLALYMYMYSMLALYMYIFGG
jgi:hypothetical protein